MSNLNSNPDEKIIEKIKKLLELTTSDNENEASHAMETAKRLMLKYSLNETNFLETNSVPEIIESQYSSSYFQKPGLKESMPRILAVIAPIFGCQAFVRVDISGFKSYHLLGFKTNIEITKFALDSLLAQGNIDARREYRKFRTVTFGLSFWRGFADGLKVKFAKEKSNEIGLELYDKVKEKLDSITTGTIDTAKEDGVARESGFQSGISSQIRSGINTSNSGKLLN